MSGLQLWVCFEPPSRPLPPDATILSFMSAAEDAAAVERYPDRVLNGREEIDSIRDSARAAYLELTARIGAEPLLANGQSLRQSLGGPGGSRWWYHRVSQRDSTALHDTTYRELLRLFAVASVAERLAPSRLVLVGAAPEFAACLASRFAIQGRSPRPSPLAPRVAAMLLRRPAQALVALGLRLLLPRPEGGRRIDVGLQGHWHATTFAEDGVVRDQLFRDLPDRLRERGVSLVSLAWFDARRGTLPSPGSALALRRAARRNGEVVALQALVPIGALLRAVADLRPLREVMRALRSERFAAVTRVRGMDLRPLVRAPLVLGAVDGAIPRGEMVALATARAAEILHPRLFLAATELFVHPRAMYAGLRLGRPEAPAWAPQHAAYSPDKTFGLLHPELEYQGRPDAEPAPVPDRVFALGAADRHVFLQSGFPEESVVVTGGLRYQHVGIREEVRTPEPGLIMMLSSLDTADEDTDMVEAVELATRGLEGFRLVLRNHPYEPRPIDRGPRWDRFAGRVEVSSATLEDDLRRAALLITACSSTANEALVRDIPTWQWVFPGPDFTSFLQVPVAPRFRSVAELRHALGELARAPERFSPGQDVRRRVLVECFGPEPGAASARIADEVTHALAGSAGLRPGPAPVP